MNLKKLIIYCDGGARGNPGPAAIGVVIKDADYKKIYEISKTIGKATNNVAEYQAVIEALQWIKKQKFIYQLHKIEFYLDSKLLVNQLNGNYKIKNNMLKKLMIKIKLLETNIGVVNNHLNNTLFSKEKGINLSYFYIPRERNTEADFLVNQALNTSIT